MDAKTHVGFLRTHSNYVTHLAMQLSALLTTMEQALEAPNADLQAVMEGKAEPLAHIQKLLAQEAQVFCARLTSFLAEVHPTKTA